MVKKLMRHSDSNISASHPGALYTESPHHCFHLIESLETISRYFYPDDFFQRDSGLSTHVARVSKILR